MIVLALVLEELRSRATTGSDSTCYDMFEEKIYCRVAGAIKALIFWRFASLFACYKSRECYMHCELVRI